MTAEKRYKRIGYAVQYRLRGQNNWRTMTMEIFKKDAIRAYDREFFKGFYRREERSDLARCVPVYVEVQDAKA